MRADDVAARNICKALGTGSNGPQLPELQMFTSKDFRLSSLKHAVNTDAEGIEIHAMAQYIGHIRPRSFDDTVPLLQLAQGLLLFTSAELRLFVDRAAHDKVGRCRFTPFWPRLDRA